MSQSAEAGANKPRSAPKGENRGLFARIALFYRQVVAELRKTVRPTKTELWTFFTVRPLGSKGRYTPCPTR